MLAKNFAQQATTLHSSGVGTAFSISLADFVLSLQSEAVLQPTMHVELVAYIVHVLEVFWQTQQPMKLIFCHCRSPEVGERTQELFDGN